MNSRRLAAALAVTLLSTVLVLARDNAWGKYEAPPDIVATLPQFCWGQYLDNVPLDPRFETCGGFTNHFCPGLVLMKKAEKEKTPMSAYWLLKEAEGSMRYTLQYTAPECFLRPRALINIQRIKFQMDMLKYKKQ